MADIYSILILFTVMFALMIFGYRVRGIPGYLLLLFGIFMGVYGAVSIAKGNGQILIGNACTSTTCTPFYADSTVIGVINVLLMICMFVIAISKHR